MESPKPQTRRVLSLKERIDVIKLSQTVRDTKKLAEHFHCGRTQILSIIHQKERLLKEWAYNVDPNRLRRRPSSFSIAVNKTIAEWVKRARNAQTPITDCMLMDKANGAKKFFQYSEFRPNRRWLERFKTRYKLDGIDLETPDPSLNTEPLKSLKIDDIYNDIIDDLDQSVVDAVNNRRLGLLLIADSRPVRPPKNDKAIIPETIVIPDGEDSEEVSKEPNSVEPIKDDQQALEYISRLEEYSMLNENFRAIGFIVQLERLYKGELEA